MYCNDILRILSHLHQVKTRVFSVFQGWFLILCIYIITNYWSLHRVKLALIYVYSVYSAVWFRFRFSQSCQLNVRWLCVTASLWKIFLLSCRFGCIVYVHCNRFSTLWLFVQAAPPGHHPRGQGLHQNDDRAVQEHRLPQHTERPETGMKELRLRRTSKMWR